MRILKLTIAALLIIASLPAVFAQEKIDYAGGKPALTPDKHRDQLNRLTNELSDKQASYPLNDKKPPGLPSAQVLDSCKIVSTSWALNNGNDGIMVNISTFEWISIDHFSVYINSFDSGYVKIYYVPDTAAGHEKIPADWTFIDSAFVTGNGTATPTLIPINVNVTMPAWSMYSFYITGTGTPNILYHNGTGTAFDSTITIWPGAGLAYPFGLPADTVYQERIFSGIVHYCEVPVGVQEVLPEDRITIAPNPFNDHTEIIFNSPLRDAEVIVYNLLGAEVKRFKANNALRVPVSREGLDAGIYFVHVSSGSTTVFVRKVVIE